MIESEDVNIKKERLCLKIQGCKKCSLSELDVNVYDGEGKGKLCLYGNIEKSGGQVLFVGQNPSIRRFGEYGAFRGRTSGDFFFTVLKESGFKEGEFVVTNLVKCSTPDNDKINKEQTIACSWHFIEELTLVRPSIVVVMGSVTRQMFHEIFGLIKHNMSESVQIFYVEHPSYIRKYSTAVQKREYIDKFVSIRGKFLESSGQMKLDEFGGIE